MPAICSSTAASSLVTTTSAPCFAPRGMIISGEPAATGIPPLVADAAGHAPPPPAPATSERDRHAALPDGLGDQGRRTGVQPDPGADGDGLTGHRSFFLAARDG